MLKFSITEEEFEHCELMGLSGVLVQMMIAILSVASLFIKRHYEFPRRKKKIFLLDMMKQCMSMTTIHIVNVFVSIIMSKEKEK